MSQASEQIFECVCGRRSAIAKEETHPAEAPIEFTCGCGRKYELELGQDAWVPTLEPITPEKRQPLTAFSGDLKDMDDCERFYFTHAGRRGGKLPVHILFSRSAAVAEISAGGLKPLRFDAVRSAVEARRRWTACFDALGSHQGRRARMRTRLRSPDAHEATPELS